MTSRDGNPSDNIGGAAYIRSQLRLLPAGPGVYRMIDARNDVLYVGKAKSLRKRVASYAKTDGHSVRIARMVMATVRLEVVTTHTEAEALLLEANLIKKLKPRYNILLRDDKSFPYILITGDHDWPQITKHRGVRTHKGEYFGPFASAGAVNETLAILQRAFPLRSCNDSDFASRTRPCLQYQIKRCTAPCVGRIGRVDYLAIVAQARDFLSGRSRQIQRALLEQMERTSAEMDFESAAVYRDRIKALTQVQSRQGANLPAAGEADVIAAHQDGGQTCIQIFFFRAGQNYGNRSYFPANSQGESVEDVLSAFIGQFYARRPAPRMVLLSHALPHMPLIAEALSLGTPYKVRIAVPERGIKRQLVELAARNAREALARQLSESATQQRMLEGITGVLGLDAPPQRIEVYDNSHIQGTNAVGAMIVVGPEGLDKAAYRKFNIRSEDLVPGDDYGMMRETLTRRFQRLVRDDPARTTGIWPDLIIIDGGRGQLSAAEDTLRDLAVDTVAVVAIAKGADRNAGRERLFLPGKAPISLPERDPVLYFLQRIRDEAHRFAIGSHRARRAKSLGTSPLDDVAGIGAKRKRALLNHFGSAREVARAGLSDLEAVQGISKTVAKTVYDHFHAEAG